MEVKKAIEDIFIMDLFMINIMFDMLNSICFICNTHKKFLSGY